MESELVHYFEYVPYTEKNKNVYSPKLLALLLQICGYIDTVFKEMAKYQEFQKIQECQEINKLEKKDYKRYNIKYARKAFEKIYKLSSNNGGYLVAKLSWIGDKEIIPFKAFATYKSPEWWHSYNNVKHTWSKALEKANIENVLEALSGAFLLNVVHYLSIKLLGQLGHLKTVIGVSGTLQDHFMPEYTFDQLLMESVSQLKPFPYDIRVETPLFLFVLIK
ncbi:MAG: hypothetical protein QG670_882 [Thermoproteota archaeon]|nr:hypothetical protein [Thermoproteota archaeon]